MYPLFRLTALLAVPVLAATVAAAAPASAQGTPLAADSSVTLVDSTAYAAGTYSCTGQRPAVVTVSVAENNWDGTNASGYGVSQLLPCPAYDADWQVPVQASWNTWQPYGHGDLYASLNLVGSSHEIAQIEEPVTIG